MSSFFQSETDSLRVPVATVVLSKMELGQLMKRIAEASTNLLTEQTIRLNYRDQYKIKAITHGDTLAATRCASEKIVKKRVATSSSKEYMAMIYTMTPAQCSEGAVQSIQLAHTMSYPSFQYPEWSLNVIASKTMSNPQEFTTRLQEYKTNLLKDYKDFIGELDERSYDAITIELRFSGSNLTKDQLLEVLRHTERLIAIDSKQDYQQMIYSVAKEIYRDQLIADKFQQRSGFKQLTPSAVELSRTIYFKDVLPTIDQFYITDKIDGQRALLQIVEYFKRAGNKKTLLGADVTSLSNDVQVLQTFEKKPANMRNVDVVKTLLDTEMLTGSGTPSFQAFDVIMIRGKRVSNMPFKVRYKEFDIADDLLRRYNLGRTKTFVKLTKDGYKKQLETFYEAALAGEHEIDGIIFTPEGLHYKEAAKQKIRRNTEYYNTVSFKWKPVEQSTIDFYMMPIEPVQAKKLRKEMGLVANTSEHWYALCSGVDIDTFKKLNLQFFDGYVPPLSENSHQYFPIQFAPYDNPRMYLWSSKESDLGGRVAEFKFVAQDGTPLGKPEIVRMRDDRSNDVRKGEYFGNALRYSELIWHSIKHPLTFEMLGLAPNDLGGYFASNSDSEYFAQRAFNSYIKGELIKKYLDPPSIIDLMCGKGQDMARVIDSGFTEITMVDRDIDALYELLQRKYNLRLKTKNASASIHIRQVDFENALEDTLRDVDLPTGVSAAMVNFGIHYLAHDKTDRNRNLPMEDFFKLVSHVLQPKGKLLVTCFNGQAIFDLLKDADEWATDDKKYSIKRAYTSQQLTDLNQPIDVLLPFSGGAYYREYLVNMTFLGAIAGEHGFKVVANESFSTMLKQFKKHNGKIYQQLSAADKEYLGLYSYMILQKQ